MRQLVIIFILLLSLMLLKIDVFALGMQENQIQGANYLITQNRLAAIGTIDCAYYNPASLVTFKDGLYVSIGNSNELYKVNQDSPAKKYKGNGYSFSPYISIVYKMDDWAIYYIGTMPQQSGFLNYDQGSLYSYGNVSAGIVEYWDSYATPAVLNDTNSHITLLTFGNTLGVSYRALSFLSAAIGCRYVYSVRNHEADFDGSGPGISLDSTEIWKDTAHGFTPIVSINITQIEDLLVALRFHGVTFLDYKINAEKSKLNNFLTASCPELYQRSGSSETRDIPGQIGLGLAYRLFELLTISLDAIYYFNYDKFLKYDKNPYAVGAGLEFDLLPEVLVVGCGVKMLRVEGNNSSYKNINEVFDEPNFDYIAVSGGLRFYYWDEIVITTGVIKPFYESFDNFGITIEKNNIIFGLGLEYRLQAY